MMKTVLVLLSGSAQAAVRVRGISKGLLIASIDHWPSYLWDSAKKREGALFFNIYMLERMHDRGSSMIKLRHLLLYAEALTRGKHRPRQEI